MNDLIQLGKEYQTRDGREVQILKTDCGGNWPVVGVVRNSVGCWQPANWSRDGRRYPTLAGDQNDLVPKVKRYKGVLIFHRAEGSPAGVLAQRTVPESWVTSDPGILRDSRVVAKIPFDFAEGEGL